MCLKDIPSERLRIFISSAQSNEGVFAWSEVRRRIKDHLKECPYLNPFIIEDVASPVKSEQFYQMQLLRADLVVLLVKGEVRKGTATEYALATTHKKPMLIYFLDDGSMKELSAVELKKDVQGKDYCTYHSTPNFDEIEKVVRKHVIETLICSFQFKAMEDQLLDMGSEVMALPNEIQISEYSVPTKTAIGLFSSCYGHIFDLLGIPQVKSEEPTEPSALHDLGVAALNWLVKGQGDISERNILAMIEHVSDLYSETDWLTRRWDAIRHEMIDDIDGALKVENNALSLARTANMPPWIIANILIDCRNIENQIFARDRKYFTSGDGQKELDKLDTIVYLPVLDRYLGNIYALLAKETAKFKMAQPGTLFMGTNIRGIINDVENYFFTAILYGSYSHMLIARDLLAKVLFQYDNLTGKEPLLFESVKLLILHANAKDFQKTLEYKWDDVYLSVASSADELWYLTDRVCVSFRDSMKRAVLTKLGMYMTDDCFEQAEVYLKNTCSSVYWGISEDYFECLFQNINRLKPATVTEILEEIIREQHFHMGGKLANILLFLKLKDVPLELQKALCKALEVKLEYIVSNGGHPQFIAALVAQNRDVFGILATLPNNGLHGTERLFYEINIGGGDWNKVIVDQINTARVQFEANKAPGIYHGFFEKPYRIIKNVIRNHYSAGMAKIINEEMLPLCTEVLSSQVPADVKDECIDCLCDVLVCCGSNEIIVTKELVDVIEKINISETYSIMGSSKNVLACRVLMLRIIVGKTDKDEMLEWCFDFGKKDRLTKVALAECIEQYLYRYACESEKIDAMILALAIQCFENDYWPVRRAACNCLAKMLVTQYKAQAERKLYEGAIDPAYYVRDYLLRLCKNGQIADQSISERIIDIMKSDANYAIRILANNEAE